MTELDAHDESIYCIQVSGDERVWLVNNTVFDSNCDFVGVVSEVGVYHDSIYSAYELAGISESG